MQTSRKLGTGIAGALGMVALLWTGAAAEPLTAARSLPLPAPVIQGLAYADGSLWMLSPMGPGMTTLIRMDPVTGAPGFSFFGGVEADALAHDGTNLFATRTAGEWLCGSANPNRIEVLDPVTGVLLNALPSPAATETGGLAFLDGLLYAAGVVDTDLCDGLTGVPTITALDPADGTTRGSFETGALGSAPRHLTSNGVQLLYGSWAGQEGAVPSPFSWTVYSLDSAGNVVDSNVLFETMALVESQASQSFDIGGMAWGNGELFVLNHSTLTVQVFDFPVAEPLPPPPPPASEVSLDIRPGDNDNCINLRSRGKIPAAVLSSTEFDATLLDPATVTLASAPVVENKLGKWKTTVQDANGDGLDDLILHFHTQDLVLTEEDIEAVLHGWTTGGEEIECSDFVKVIHGDRLGGKFKDRMESPARKNGGEQRLDPLGNSLSLALVGSNPSRGKPVLSFTLPGNQPATLEIVSVTGRRVSRQEIGHLGPGTHTLGIESPLPAGTYFIRLRQGTVSAVTKVSVLH